MAADSLIDQRSWVERKGFSDWSVAVFWIFAAFLLFQVVGGMVAAILFVTTSSQIPTAQEIMNNTGEYLDLVFIGNSTGQILFLGLGTWGITQLHLGTSKKSEFLRFSKSNKIGTYILLAVILMIAIQPMVWFLSWLNSLLPIPQSVFELEQMQTDVIEKYLTGDHSVLLTLFHVSLVPAVCEEILFRGYLLRIFQNKWGARIAIVVTGIIFGCFHLRFMQFIPLMAIGIVLGYITWSTESIFPAMVAHLVNNGGSVLAVYAYPKSSFAEMSPETMPPVTLVIASLVLSGYLLYLLSRYKTQSQLA